MVAQTSGMAQEMPTLDAMVKAAKRIEREVGRPATEYRIHPEDWAALRTQLKTAMTKPSSGGPEVFGLRIILDPSAERLPIR